MSKTLITTAVILAAGTAALGDITKGPDLGNYWFPIGPQGSYVYADSFVAEEDCVVSDLGTWLAGFGDAPVRFEIWGDTGGSGPDAGNVMSSTGTIAAIPDGNLNYNQFSASPANLIGGQTYWFAVTAVGETGFGSWQVGGHTQNSVYNDNGTFWYSNDSSGVFFDGQNLTPEMAFSVICRVPTPGTAALLGLGGLAAIRRRRA